MYYILLICQIEVLHWFDELWHIVQGLSQGVFVTHTVFVTWGLSWLVQDHEQKNVKTNFSLDTISPPDPISGDPLIKPPWWNDQWTGKQQHKEGTEWSRLFSQGPWACSLAITLCSSHSLGCTWTASLCSWKQTQMWEKGTRNKREEGKKRRRNTDGQIFHLKGRSCYETRTNESARKIGMQGNAWEHWRKIAE